MFLDSLLLTSTDLILSAFTILSALKFLQDKKRAQFVDFVSKLLTIDPDSRPSAAEALNHPWITSSLDLSEDEIRYGQ